MSEETADETLADETLVDEILACKNNDLEIWREIDHDYYSPSIHVTKNGEIGLKVAGRVIVKPIREWHRLAELVKNGEIRYSPRKQ